MDLKPYQEEIIKAAQSRRNRVIVFDEPGLGKTLSYLELGPPPETPCSPETSAK